MKSLKSRLIIATVFLFVVLALSIVANNVINQVSQRDVAVSDAVLPDMPQDTVASDSILPQAQLPVLKIDGKENSDVYLQSLDVQVEVTGNIASTRYTMVFKNRTNRILEGELTFPLPDGRSATHYALDVNGRMRDAVPVGKASGTQVFEEIEQRRRVVDPGLLERVEGNNLRTRIYPIPANGKRTVSIGYEEELTLERGLLYYRLPMVYSEPLEKFAVKATVLKSSQKPLVPKSDNELSFDISGENHVAWLTRENYRPSRALIFALPAPADIPQVMRQPAQGSHYFLASVVPRVQMRKKQWDNDLAIIWDVSLSGSQRNLQREIEMLGIIFAEKKNANVHLYFLNNKNTKKGEYKVVDGNWNGLKNALEAAIFDGGTDFSKIDLNNIAGNEILFFSDGISTLSDADFLKNTKANRPIHCIVSSARTDYSTMKLLASKTKGKFVNANALSSEKLRDELLNETLLFLGAEHGNAVHEVYPSIATPVHGNFSVAGISKINNAELTLLFGFGDRVEKRIKVQLNANNATNQGNTYKIWAQKKIAELDLNYEKNRSELMELGQQFGIVTRNISLIVLEAIGDYVLYGIEPPATEPVLRAEYKRRMKGSEQRFKLLGGAPDAEASTSTRESSGRRGSASGGFNEGYAEGGSGGIGDMLGGLMGGSAGGIGTKAKGSLKAPSARDIDMGSGDNSRSKAEVMAVVNARMPGLRNIYNKYLKLRPKFGGKVTLKFTIVPSGDVIDIAIVSSTTDYSDFDNAVKNMVAAWKWKAIKSGNTTPTVPFNFSDYPPADVAGSSAREVPKPREVIPQSREGVTLIGAAAAATNLKRWWNINYTPQKSKYPVPGEKASVPYINPAKGSYAKNDYLGKLTGKTADDYQTYLKLRTDYANSPTFYFDMSNWFYSLGDRETALRILTSIADLELENASLYRLLGYKFKEYGEYKQKKFVCQKVVEWRPMEPQSHRDYALALADNGEEQAALDTLYSLLRKPYSRNILNRSRGIEEVIVMEMNRLIAKNPSLNTSKIEKGLLINIPVDIRVVINWNMDNTDIDLHVKDPNNEECYYGHRETRIGGRISTVPSGYGPEQFILKNAIPGKYRVYVSYYSRREFTSTGPYTIMAEVFTKYSDKTEQRKVVSLQMSNVNKRGDGKMEVAEFSF
ncbi:MAG: TonB family protein [Candidatus Fibromonas sp.]|jgi:TonB family protein|nr:TonB family protein [Candidatus Fibromonas sp.]